MSMGAVLDRTGTIRASDLGGLYRSMPWTTAFCIVGAMSIFGVPLFSGFVAKSLTMSAVVEGYYVWTLWGFDRIGGCDGAFGIKIHFAFFGQDSGIRCKEAPLHMCLAMGATAILCITIGWPRARFMHCYRTPPPTSLTRISGIPLRNSSCCSLPPSLLPFLYAPVCIHRKKRRLRLIPTGSTVGWRLSGYKASFALFGKSAKAEPAPADRPAGI